MNSRDLNKRIAIYSTEPVSDGFGGFTTSGTLVGNSWAKIESVSPGKAKSLTDYGIDDPQNTIQITARKREDLVYNLEWHYVIYRGSEYKIVSTPTNTNFEDRFITFMATKKSISSNTAAP